MGSAERCKTNIACYVYTYILCYCNKEKLKGMIKEGFILEVLWISTMKQAYRRLKNMVIMKCSPQKILCDLDRKIGIYMTRPKNLLNGKTSLLLVFKQIHPKIRRKNYNTSFSEKREKNKPDKASTAVYCLPWWFSMKILQMITESGSRSENYMGTFSFGNCIGWQLKDYEYFIVYDLCDWKKIVVLLRLTVD